MNIEGTLYTDGGARGNPGPAGIGGVLAWADDYGRHTHEFGEYIGSATNNVAEYTALLRGLTLAKERDIEALDCFCDSELLVKQLNREYRVKDVDLQKLFIKVWNVVAVFQRCTFTHIPREKNKRADALVNEAIDKQAVL